VIENDKSVAALEVNFPRVATAPTLAMSCMSLLVPTGVGLCVGVPDPCPGQSSLAEPITTSSAAEFVDIIIACLSAAVALVGSQISLLKSVAMVVITHTDFLGTKTRGEGFAVDVGDAVGRLVGKLAFCPIVGDAVNKVFTTLEVGVELGKLVGMLLGIPVGLLVG
jgi:hypothetical protein